MLNRFYVLVAALVLTGTPAASQSAQQAEDAISSVLDRARDAGADRIDPGSITADERQAIQSSGVERSSNQVLRQVGTAAGAPVEAASGERLKSNERPAGNERGGAADDDKSGDADKDGEPEDEDANKTDDQAGNLVRSTQDEGDKPKKKTSRKNSEPAEPTFSAETRTITIPRSNSGRYTAGTPGQPGKFGALTLAQPKPLDSPKLEPAKQESTKQDKSRQAVAVQSGPSALPTRAEASSFEAVKAPQMVRSVAAPASNAGFGALEHAPAPTKAPVNAVPADKLATP